MMSYKFEIPFCTVDWVNDTGPIMTFENRSMNLSKSSSWPAKSWTRPPPWAVRIRSSLEERDFLRASFIGVKCLKASTFGSSWVEKEPIQENGGGQCRLFYTRDRQVGIASCEVMEKDYLCYTGAESHDIVFIIRTADGKYPNDDLVLIGQAVILDSDFLVNIGKLILHTETNSCCINADCLEGSNR